MCTKYLLNLWIANTGIILGNLRNFARVQWEHWLHIRLIPCLIHAINRTTIYRSRVPRLFFPNGTQWIFSDTPSCWFRQNLQGKISRYLTFYFSWLCDHNNLTSTSGVCKISALWHLNSARLYTENNIVWDKQMWFFSMELKPKLWSISSLQEWITSHRKTATSE